MGDSRPVLGSVSGGPGRQREGACWGNLTPPQAGVRFCVLPGNQCVGPGHHTGAQGQAGEGGRQELGASFRMGEAVMGRKQVPKKGDRNGSCMPQDVSALPTHLMLWQASCGPHHLERRPPCWGGGPWQCPHLCCPAFQHPFLVLTPRKQLTPRTLRPLPLLCPQPGAPP